MIPLFKPFLNKADALRELSECFDSGCISTGGRTKEFASKLADRLSRKEDHCIPTSSCTASLNIALRAIYKQINPTYTPRVVCSSLTCWASGTAVLNQGFIPRWADVSYDNHLCLDLEDVERKLTENSQVVLWTSWGGSPIDMYEVGEISKRYENKYGKPLYWVLDLAHAFGTLWRGKELPACRTSNTFYCYSFGAIKTLTCSDGGLLITPPEFSDLCEKLSWYGLSRRNNASFRAWSDVEDIGSKWNMNDVSASIGLANLKTVGYNLSRSRDNVDFYLKNIKSGGVSLFPAKSFAGSSCWLFTILVENRDDFVKYVGSKGVTANGVHRPNHTLSCVKQYKTSLPYLDSISDSYCCIPCHGQLKQNEVEQIVDACNAY